MPQRNVNFVTTTSTNQEYSTPHSRCVPTKTPSPERRSTLERYCRSNLPQMDRDPMPGGAMDDKEFCLTDYVTNRASSMSVETARYSASRMARPNLCSYNERTPAVSHGPSSSEDNTRKAYLRYESPLSPPALSIYITGTGQHTNSPRHNRKSPRSARAARSSTSAPSSAPRWT
jgi:hypothetical protein